MKREEATVGRWIKGYGKRLHIAGQSVTGGFIVEDDDNDAWIMHNFDGYELLPAECKSFDWKPEPAKSPDDWVTQDRVPLRACDRFRWIKADGWRFEIECRRKDLPPLPESEPSKPAIDPGEGYRWLGDDEVTLPTDEREYVGADAILDGDWMLLIDANPKMIGITCSDVRKQWANIVIRRKVEPAKPATRKVVINRYAVTDEGKHWWIVFSDKSPEFLQHKDLGVYEEIEVPL